VIDAIECAGAPRDLGLDQGRACRQSLREAFQRSPWRERWPLPLGAAHARVARDLKRHFPHLAESLAGLAVGAGVPERWLVRRLAAELAAPRRARVAACISPAGPLLAIDGAGPWIARRSRPEGGFACLELARPWLVAACAGVNEAGLAVVASSGSAAPGDCAAPAALLAQDCLQRFARVESALDWCCGRPAGASAALLFADARAELAGVELRGDSRRLLHPESGVLAWEDAGGASLQLAKALREAAPASPAELVRAFAPAAARRLSAAVLDPGTRRLGVLSAEAAGREPEWLALSALPCTAPASLAGTAPA
jgi:hypothetical protein